jgi:hypothetical protein
MPTTEEEFKGIIDSSAEAAKEAVTDGTGIIHKIGAAIEAAADEVANVAGQTLETVGRQMKDTTKHEPSPKK